MTACLRFDFSEGFLCTWCDTWL